MKKGYRFNSAIAYANYCADVNNVANFNRFGGMVDAVKRRSAALGQGVLSAAGKAKGAAVRGVQELDNQVMGVGEGIYGGTVGLGGRRMYQTPGAARKRALGYGTLGAAGAGLGAAGYGGYRALRPKQEEEEMY